ncbi:DUF1194 domain-containing protein [Pseudopelagicola sp. nBUS_19]|uniref:DUF1194 domain-containing protein n=1 Tax=Pseudopelagicola sp. nBUS_19 TaxID=3395316 RepID=UPI003EBFA102
MANALLNSGVSDLLLFSPQNPTQIAVFKWSGPTSQRLLIDWTTISAQEALNSFIGKLNTTQRTTMQP